MLILSTYRVVLHPSYLQRIFVIFIKERYNFIIPSENSQASGGVSWAELKNREHAQLLCSDRLQAEILITQEQKLYRLKLTITNNQIQPYIFDQESDIHQEQQEHQEQQQQ